MNTKQTEALKLALEVLEEINKLSIGENAICLPAEIDTAMDAIREALAEQPAQQEPVAWISQSENLLSWDKFYDDMTPLYTSPPAQPSKPWVGLTDEEIDECERLATIRHQRHKYSARGQLITPADGLEWHFAGAIEAKLKEKNT